MRNTLTALLSAASICAFAGVVPAAAQAFYGSPSPYAVAPGPYVAGPTKGESIVPPQISYSLPPSEETARPGVVGSCSLLDGNRVCTDTPAYGAGPAYGASGYGYGYGYGAPGGLVGAAVAAPFAAAGALAAVPFEAAGATAGALAGAPYEPAPYAAAPMGYRVGPYPAGGPVKGGP